MSTYVYDYIICYNMTYALRSYIVSYRLIGPRLLKAKTF